MLETSGNIHIRKNTHLGIVLPGGSLHGPWAILPKVRRCRFRPLVDLFTSREEILLLSAGIDILQTRTQETVNVRYAVGNLNKFVTLSLKAVIQKIHNGKLWDGQSYYQAPDWFGNVPQPYITRNHTI